MIPLDFNFRFKCLEYEMVFCHAMGEAILDVAPGHPLVECIRPYLLHTAPH